MDKRREWWEEEETLPHVFICPSAGMLNPSEEIKVEQLGAVTIYVPLQLCRLWEKL